MSKLPPQSIIRRAATLVRQQGETSLSPASKSANGRVALCAAAAIVAAALEVKCSRNARRDFEAKATSLRSPEDLCDYFRGFGWSTKFCEDVIIKNNCLHITSGTDNIVEYLEGLVHLPDDLGL